MARDRGDGGNGQGGGQDQKAKDRCRAARQAIADRMPAGVPLRVQTRHGDVEFADVAEADVDGIIHLEVRLAGPVVGDDPHFRIFNPPTLVEDPNGDVQERGRRYRVDPVAAVAELIASAGGAQRTGARR